MVSSRGRLHGVRKVTPHSHTSLSFSSFCVVVVFNLTRISSCMHNHNHINKNINNIKKSSRPYLVRSTHTFCVFLVCCDCWGDNLLVVGCLKCCATFIIYTVTIGLSIILYFVDLYISIFYIYIYIATLMLNKSCINYVKPGGGKANNCGWVWVF